MMVATPETLLLLSLVLPVACALVLPFLARWPNLREGVTLVTAAALFLVVIDLYLLMKAGIRPEINVLRITTGLRLGFESEPLGMVFALIASSLWIANSIYSIGYMRSEKEPRQTRFYTAFAIAIAGAIGIAFAGNLFTMFLFYEVMTLSTYPLIIHKRTEEALRAGRIYLLVLLGASLILFLPAIIGTRVIAGSLEFVPGGLFAGRADTAILALLLGMFVFGLAKAALMPLHFWLPAAMVAPTPVSALLHAVAVVKAGVFCIVKIVIYIFGPQTLIETGASTWLIYVAAASILISSLIALSKDNLKARLAYSTISQLSYVVLGAALATTAGLTGAIIQIAAHAFGKITLFFCAGAIYVVTHKTEISQLDGIGRKMPVTMIAFLLGSLSIIGIPPLVGIWSKWYLAMAAVDTNHYLIMGVLLLSSFLNIAYLLPIVGRAFFLIPKDEKPKRGKKPPPPPPIIAAPIACLVPLSLTAIGCVVLFFCIDIFRTLAEAALAY